MTNTIISKAKERSTNRYTWLLQLSAAEIGNWPSYGWVQGRREKNYRYFAHGWQSAQRHQPRKKQERSTAARWDENHHQFGQHSLRGRGWSTPRRRRSASGTSRWRTTLWRRLAGWTEGRWSIAWWRGAEEESRSRLRRNDIWGRVSQHELISLNIMD